MYLGHIMELGELESTSRAGGWKAFPGLSGVALENYPRIMQPGFSMFQGILKFASVFIG